MAYGRGLSDYLELCRREGVEPVQRSNPRERLWSNEVAGEELLDRVRHRV